MYRLLIAVLPVLAFVPACAVVAPGDLLQDTGAASSAGGDEGDEDVLVSSILECELPLPCEDPFEARRLAEGGDSAYTDSDFCVFKTLAGDAPALVQTTAEFSDGVAFLDYAVIGPRKALQQAWGVSDARGKWDNDAVVCDLQAPEFFAACAEAPAGDCLDPERWVVRCDPLDILACPG